MQDETYDLAHSGGGARRPPLKLEINRDGDEVFDIIVSNEFGRIASVTLKYADSNLIVHAENWADADPAGTLNPTCVIEETVIVEGATAAVPLEGREPC